ncbi:MAG: type II toxin-antitoxin system PrlF family antitoxin [Thermodesulfobacteriota bacterium]|nr:type II toxin-antitoxin system PrlF family antitoxin [Thermodesulfobacteriota bacterium]
MITSTVSSKGQVTIPKVIREFLKVEKFDKIVFIPFEEGKVMITNKQIPASELFGMLKHRNPKQPVSVQEMDAVIRKRRTERGIN